MPGRKWYAIAAGVFLAGMALFGLFLFMRLMGLTGELQQVVVPGEAELVLDEPGSYTIFHERESVVDGRYYSSPEEISGLEVRVVSSATGAPVQLEAPGASTTYSLGGRAGVSIFSFTIEKPGRYHLSAGYPGGVEGGQLVLAVGHGFGRKLVETILGGVGIGFASFALAVTIAGVTFWKRRKGAGVPPGAAATPRP
jgi:hypothetical protein